MLVLNLQSQAQGHLFAATPRNPPWLTPTSHNPLTHKMPQWAFLLSLHLHTTRQPLPLGDNLFPGSASLCSPRIHPHRHPLSHFPKQKNTFLAARLCLFFPSLGCLKTQSSTSKTLTIPIYPVNLTPFSLCSFFLLRNTHVLTHIRAQPQTHTYLKFISAAIQMQRSNFQYWYIYREKHRDPSRHTNTCAHKHVK